MGESSRNPQDTGQRLRAAPLLFQQIVNLLAGQGLGYQLLPKGCTVKAKVDPIVKTKIIKV